MMAGRGPRFVGGIVAICVCLVFDSVKATAFSLVGRYSCDFNENFSSAFNSGRLGFVEEFKMSINGAYGSTKRESQFAGKTFTKLFSVDLKKMKLRVVVTMDGVINDQHDFSFNGTLPGVVPLNGSATYLNRNNRAIQGKIFAACLGSLVSRPDNWRFSLGYLDTISAKIMVEDALSAIERVKLVEVLARAKRRSTEFYQTLMGPDPDLLVCATSDCAIFVSGPSQRSRYLAGGGSWGGSQYSARNDTVVLNNFSPTAERFLVHEWSHNEFRHRLQGQPVPDWFNEGVATYISGEPVCSEPPMQVIRLAELERGWTTFTDDVNKRDDTYCTARNEVAVWISLHKKEGLFRLLRDIAARTHDFRSAYGAIISQ